jgi:hypothetical protein
MNETKIDLGRIARELAALLPGWTYSGPGGSESAEYWQVLTRQADGATVHVNGNSWGQKGRLVISGGYPRTKRGEDMGSRNRPSITVDPTRPVERIAADITRRFLPEYEPLYAEARRKTEEWDKAQDLAAVRCAEAADMIGGRVNSEKNGVSWYRDGNGYGDATTTTGESWTLKLHSLTWEQAQAVLKIVGR